jgi:hypothetical protein
MAFFICCLLLALFETSLTWDVLMICALCSLLIFLIPIGYRYKGYRYSKDGKRIGLAKTRNWSFIPVVSRIIPNSVHISERFNAKDLGRREFEDKLNSANDDVLEATLRLSEISDNKIIIYSHTLKESRRKRFVARLEENISHEWKVNHKARKTPLYEKISIKYIYLCLYWDLPKVYPVGGKIIISKKDDR